MTRMIYQGARKGVLAKQAYFALPAFALFGLGAYLEDFHAVPWATTVAGVLALAIFGYLGLRNYRAQLSRLPCPKCGRAPLRQAEDDQRTQILICDACAIEWDVQISTVQSD